MLKKVLLAAVAATAVVLPITANGAHAAPKADHFKTQYLTSAPKSSMPASYSQRRIYLAAGNYRWSLTPGRSMDDTSCFRIVYLGAGWYTWTNKLWPNNGFYDNYSVLNPDNPNWGSIYGECTWDFTHSGNKTWGSTLAPRF
jgi:hypothetical protein